MCSITFSEKSSLLWDKVQKYGGARQATDWNIIRRIRCACWINEATNTHCEYVIHITSMVTLVTRTHLSATFVRTLHVVFNDVLWKCSEGSPNTSSILFPVSPIAGRRLIYLKAVSLCQFIFMIRLPWILRCVCCVRGAPTWWGSVSIAECGCIWNTQTESRPQVTVRNRKFWFNTGNVPDKTRQSSL